MIRASLRAVERFLLPNSCVACGSMVGSRDPDALVCGPCQSRMRPVPDGCERCQQPLPPVGPCRFCSGWPEGLTRARSAVWLGEEAREAVHNLKYKGYTLLAEMMAVTMARRVAESLDRVCLVPVPLGARRLSVRGYNQAAELATCLGRMWQVPVQADVVRRCRETTSQTKLTPEERCGNVRGAFKAIRPLSCVEQQTSPFRDVGAVALGSNVAILVDDVLTTGATIASAAAALLDAGWAEVRAVTFARALAFAERVEADI